MAPKKASATGVAALQPLDHNQETVSLREARSQKRKAVSPTPPEDDFLRQILNEEGLSTAVGDEGGFAPDVKDTREVFRYLQKADVYKRQVQWHGYYS